MFAVLFKTQIYNHWLSITVALSETSFERKTLSYILGQTFMMCNTKRYDKFIDNQHVSSKSLYSTIF